MLTTNMSRRGRNRRCHRCSTICLTRCPESQSRSNANQSNDSVRSPISLHCLPTIIIIAMQGKKQPSFPPPPLKSATLINPRLQQKLKSEINNKFSKRLRKDEVNYSTLSMTRRNSSLLLSNPLTKSSFSLSDAITHKGASMLATEPIKKAAKSLSSRKFIALSCRQKLSPCNDSIFQTRAEVAEWPKESTLKPRQQSELKVQSPDRSLNNARNCKFKLLFKEKSTQYRSASQRKIARLDSKISLLKQKRTYLESMVPYEKVVARVVKTGGKSLGCSQQEFKEKVGRMAQGMVRIVELFFNLYQHNNIVGGHFRKVEGFNRRIQHILMLDDLRAKRFTNPSELTTLFQVFHEIRGEHFVDEDLSLLSLLSNFLMKLQRKYQDLKDSFSFFQRKRQRDEQDALKKTRERFQRRLGKHQSINKINHFIQNRLRFDQSRREEYMTNLEKRGVVLNLVQRSRQLVLRQRQNAIKASLTR